MNEENNATNNQNENNSPQDDNINMIENFKNSIEERPKTYFFVGIAVALLIGFGCGRIGTVSSSQYEDLSTQKNNLQAEYASYQAKMHPYEAQLAADTNARQEAEKKAAEEKAAQEKAQKEAEEKAAQEKAQKEAEEKAKKEAEKTQPPSSTAANTNTSSTSTVTGKMPKNYTPVGNEPDWIEVLTYCETVMPDFIGSDASIALTEDYTTIIRTNLRYKLETSRLKKKNDGTYHKALIVIEFTDDTYSNYNVVNLEIDGVKII